MIANLDFQKYWMQCRTTWALPLMILVFLFTVDSEAKEKKKTSGSKAPKVAQSVPSKRLKKDVSFDDYSVKGKYLVPLNSVTVVEEDKSIDDLIGVRKNFDDRAESAKEMR